VALLPSQISHWPYDYYSQKKVPLMVAAKGFGIVKKQTLANLFVDREKPEKIYYLYYLTDLFDPQNLIPYWLSQNKFVKIKETSFNQLKIEEWEK